jgi:ribosome-associated protein
VASEEERSQNQNRAKAIARLESLATHALQIPKKRRPTRPTLASKIKRIENKKRRSEIKAKRRFVEM